MKGHRRFTNHKIHVEKNALHTKLLYVCMLVCYCLPLSYFWSLFNSLPKYLYDNRFFFKHGLEYLNAKERCRTKHLYRRNIIIFKLFFSQVLRSLSFQLLFQSFFSFVDIANVADNAWIQNNLLLVVVVYPELLRTCSRNIVCDV